MPSQKEKDEEFDRDRDLEAARQALPPGSQPEQRPQSTISPAPVHGAVHDRLVEADSPLAGNQPRMDREAFELAQTRAEDPDYEDKAAPAPEFFPGTTAYIQNPRGRGSEHNGRAVAVNIALGRDEKTGLPLEYETRTRDGRAEMLVVSHEHLRPVSHVDFQRTQT